MRRRNKEPARCGVEVRAQLGPHHVHAEAANRSAIELFDSTFCVLVVQVIHECMRTLQLASTQLADRLEFILHATVDLSTRGDTEHPARRYPQIAQSDLAIETADEEGHSSPTGRAVQDSEGL